MPTITDDELARVLYLLHQVREVALQLEGSAWDRAELALTEARKVLRLVEARG